MAIPVSRVQKLHLLLNRLNINTKEDKQQFAWQYSDGETESTSALTLKQYNQLIADLQKRVNTSDAANTMRRKIISRAHEMSWTIDVDGKKKADMKRINGWCVSYGYLHKALNDYTLLELPKLVTQFDNMYLDFLKRV
ncbi:MAG TPA: hypothetical protein PK431_01590 [Chitinophagales bacterium]|nr:hypothetical protein [Chitinophagales bacterium]